MEAHNELVALNPLARLVSPPVAVLVEEMVIGRLARKYLSRCAAALRHAMVWYCLFPATSRLHALLRPAYRMLMGTMFATTGRRRARFDFQHGWFLSCVPQSTRGCALYHA